ncbi:hypothetical protein [Streptomyces albireticuli]|nr:hypothetical protein [Streptomyces albireticuli]MCD9141471.1 hypothetical protein [Streptomyces albireticuli]MCD9164278.1 hypothetical protein [Streptomyces albireticuli]MCD9196403.1 hypothetical protein [Streptomyces albireticuli]
MRTSTSAKTPVRNDISPRLALKVSAVARALKYDELAVSQAVRAGQLPSIEIGTRHLVPTMALARLLEVTPEELVAAAYPPAADGPLPAE